jgi:hypothetical protein
MKVLFRLGLVIVLGGVAVGLDITLWNAWRTGHPYTTPIMGVVTRRGITTTDPVTVLSYMTVLFNAGFLASVIALFPGVGMWIKRKRDEIWPPTKDRAPLPSWICVTAMRRIPVILESAGNARQFERAKMSSVPTHKDKGLK